MKVKLSKKQLRLLELVEKCGYLFRNEVNKQKYPDSLVDALINKGMLSECKNKLTRTTAV